MSLPKPHFRGLLAAIVLTFCLGLVAGCGGDDDKKSSSSSDTTAAESTPSDTATEEAAAPEGDFAAQANKLCEEGRADIQPLAEAEDAAGIVARSSQLTEDLAALEPPADQQEQFDKLIELAHESDAESMRIVEDGGTIEDLAKQDSTEADAIATELGWTSCV